MIGSVLPGNFAAVGTAGFTGTGTTMAEECLEAAADDAFDAEVEVEIDVETEADEDVVVPVGKR